jgi:ABC-type antimicrobial peptide transport system permease subunit
MALGADRQRVRALVLRRSGVLLALGVAVGLLGALAASRFAGSLLYGVSATDPWTYLASAVVLALLGVLAVLVPALRATRLEPAVELRAE